MRYLEQCPCCQYQEKVNWRPRFMNVDHDMVEFAELPVTHAAASLKNGESVVDGQWAYYRTRTGRWVYRMQASAFENLDSFRHRTKIGEGHFASQYMKQFNRNLAAKKKTPKLEVYTKETSS